MRLSFKSFYYLGLFHGTFKLTKAFNQVLTFTLDIGLRFELGVVQFRLLFNLLFLDLVLSLGFRLLLGLGLVLAGLLFLLLLFLLLLFSLLLFFGLLFLLSLLLQPFPLLLGLGNLGLVDQVLDLAVQFDSLLSDEAVEKTIGVLSQTPRSRYLGIIVFTWRVHVNCMM